MKNNKVAVNLFYQTIFQVVKIIIPIITIPIVSRALGPKGIGINSFTNSVAQYFILFAALGISIYGNREIAISKNNRKKMLQTFNDIFIMKLITTIFSLIIYFVLIFIFYKENMLFFILQSINIIAVFIDISWFFMGLEDFKKTSLANLFVQLITFGLIVYFIKKPADIGYYILIQAVGNIVAQIIPWFFLIHEYKRVFMFPILSNIKKHFLGTVKYFIPQIAIIMYSTLNKTILGTISTEENVGYYTNTVSLVSAIVTIVTTIDLVMLPRMSNLFSTNNIRQIDTYISKSINAEMYVATPIAFGLAAISSKFVPWFFGESFSQLSILLPIMSPLIIIIPLGVSISRQYLLPQDKTKEYTISVFIGALVSIVTSLAMIPILGLYGAIVANLLAEIVVTLYRVKWFLKNTVFRFNKLYYAKIIFSSLVMSISIYFIFHNSAPSILITCIQVVFGVIIYLFLSYILKIDFIIKFFGKFLNKRTEKK